MSQFNPDTFLSTTTTDSNATRYEPIPEGEYKAMIEKVDGRDAKGARILDITYLILEQEQLAERLGLRNLVVRQSIFLDVNDDGLLDSGPNKNVKLGKLRDAVGQNKKGQPWSPLMLAGAGPVLIQVSVRPDKEDPEVLYNDVKRVVAAR